MKKCGLICAFLVGFWFLGLSAGAQAGPVSADTAPTPVVTPQVQPAEQPQPAEENVGDYKKSTTSRAHGKDRLFLEIWSDTGWQETHFGVDMPGYRERDWVLSQNTIKAGYRFLLGNNWFLDPYLRLEVMYDFANHDSWNKYYWTNNEKWGPGARIRHEWKNEAEEQTSWFALNSFDWDALFLEYMMIEDSFDHGKDRLADTVPDDNFRIGTSFYNTASSKVFCKEKLSLFQECWGEWAYSTTDFYQKGLKDYYILMLQPKAGLKWQFEDFSLQPYYGADLTYDFGNQPWNKHEWLNTIQYGPGARFSFTDIWGHKGTTVHIYAEYLKSWWWSRVDPAEYANKADHDTRVGIELWLPFGSTKESITRL